MYNTDDLAQIQSAILKLQSGERVVSVAYGDHAVKYAEVDLQELIRFCWHKGYLREIIVEAKSINDWKVLAILSKRENILLKCLSFPKKHSIKCLSLYTSLQNGAFSIRLDLLGITAWQFLAFSCSLNKWQS